MVDIKDKLVSLELLKWYHDYNAATYTKTTVLIYNGSAIINDNGEAMSFSSIQTLISDTTNCVEVKYNSRIMYLLGKSDAFVEFWEVHDASNKIYIDKLTVYSDNRISLKENQIALSGDIIKNLSGMTGDTSHRTVSDEQISAWNGKSDFSGNWSDLSGKPIATVAQTKQYLNIQ